MTTYKSQINPSQVSSHPHGLKTEYVVIPAQSSPSFGGMFTIMINQTNLFLHNIILNFNTNAIQVSKTGGTYLANEPRLLPVNFWCQKIEIKIGSVVVQTLYDTDIFQHIQLLSPDEQHRLFLNDGAGVYSNPAQRATLTNTNSSDWFLNLKSFINQTHIPILSLGHQITLNIYMNPLANLSQIDISGGTLTSQSMNINSCSAICRVTRMTQDLVNSTTMMLTKTPTTYLFSDVKYQSFVVQSGVSQYTGVLSNITGKVQCLYFVIRPTASLTGDNAFSYTPITQFEIRDGGSQNIVGGSPIKATFNQTIQCAHWLKTWYLNDSYAGTSNSNVYFYSHAIDPLVDTNTGKSSGGSRTYQGTESLRITFPSATSTTYQVDLFAYVQSAVCLTATSAMKVNPP